MSNPHSSSSSEEQHHCQNGEYVANWNKKAGGGKRRQVSFHRGEFNRTSSWRKLFQDTLLSLTRYPIQTSRVVTTTIDSSQEEQNSDTSDAIDDDISFTSELTSWSTLGSIPSLNIVIMVVGTRGDVQPFVALGMELQKHGHRVRIASHQVYRSFVVESGLEFYPLGGDPKILIEQLVRNKGIVAKSLKDIRFSRRYVREVMFPSLDACISPDPGDPDCKTFQADVIIANPPAYGHIHCGEYLEIPVHIMFTMPYTPTQHFPHPMARIGRQNLANQMGSLSKRILLPAVLGKPSEESTSGWANLLTYHAVDDFIWMGIGDIINRFRRKLSLRPLYGASSLSKRLSQVPWTYCWSPALLPKPSDWGSEIAVAGFFFFKSNLLAYRPPEQLAHFLQSGPPPIYFGFGSLIFKRSREINDIIVQTVQRMKVRAIIQRGWCGLSSDIKQEQSNNILYIDACPHDWLFPKCAAVVHHGGAGTTASGLLAGCSTMVVFFFGDQAFWGEACYNAGVGPLPISSDCLTTDNLTTSIKVLMDKQVQLEATKMQKQLMNENGLRNAVESFHQNLPVESIIRKDQYGSCAKVVQTVADECDIEPCTLGSLRRKVVFSVYDILTYRRRRRQQSEIRQRRRWRRRVCPASGADL